MGYRDGFTVLLDRRILEQTRCQVERLRSTRSSDLRGVSFCVSLDLVLSRTEKGPGPKAGVNGNAGSQFPAGLPLKARDLERPAGSKVGAVPSVDPFPRAWGLLWRGGDRVFARSSGFASSRSKQAAMGRRSKEASGGGWSARGFPSMVSRRATRDMTVVIPVGRGTWSPERR